jgi:penicillin-binding protein 1C
MGNNNAKPMARIASGITGAAPIWNKIITTILSNKESVKWEIPEGVIQMSICQLTGTLPCEGCPLKNELFSKDNKPNKYCSAEQIRKIQEEKNASPNPSPTGQILDTGASTQRR